jgi:CARDB
MRSSLVIGSLLLLALGGAAAPALASASSRDAVASPAKVPLSAKTIACTTGAEPASRAAAFTGSMPAITGTRRMQMRFRLQQMAGDTGSYKRIDVPGWGGWEKADPGRPGFVFTRRVDALMAPASYRAQITFRWSDRKGRALRTTTRTSTPCVQPDARPDLVLGGLEIAPNGTDQAIYTLSVSNDGRSAAGAFTVTLTVDGTVLPPLTLGPLGAGERRQGAIAGARCSPGSTVTVTVDAGGTVDESDEADDVVGRPCMVG